MSELPTKMTARELTKMLDELKAETVQLHEELSEAEYHIEALEKLIIHLVARQEGIQL